MANGNKGSGSSGYEVAVRAAGGVVCRSKRGGIVEVAVVHLRASDGWTLPKGRLYQGETLKQAALREVREETGLRCQLLRSLGCTHYLDSRGRPKIACYWLMRRLAGRFRPGDEVDDLRWLPFGDAVALVTRERDRAVLRRAEVLGSVEGAWLRGSGLSGRSVGAPRPSPGGGAAGALRAGGATRP